MMDDGKEIKKQTLIPRWLRRLAINLILFLGFVIASDYYRQGSLLDKGTLAPRITVKSLQEGNQVEVPQPGKPTIVYFSAPWCSVCSLTGNSLTTAESWLKGLGAELDTYEVSLSYKSVDDVRNYAEEGGKKSIYLGTSAIGKDYLIGAFPTFYFINAEGKVVWTTVGYTSSFGLFWRFLVYS